MTRRPPAASGARYRALLGLLRAAETVWNSSRTFFARWNLSPAQFNVLNLLGGKPEGLTQSDLGRHLLTHRSNVTGLVDRLQERGLVRRRDVVSDRRAWRVELTPEGARLRKEILPHYHAAAEAVWNGVPRDQLAEVEAVLEVLIQNATRMPSLESSPDP